MAGGEACHGGRGGVPWREGRRAMAGGEACHAGAACRAGTRTMELQTRRGAPQLSAQSAAAQVTHCSSRLMRLMISRGLTWWQGGGWGGGEVGRGQAAGRRFSQQRPGQGEAAAASGGWQGARHRRLPVGQQLGARPAASGGLTPTSAKRPANSSSRRRATWARRGGVHREGDRHSGGDAVLKGRTGHRERSCCRVQAAVQERQRALPARRQQRAPTCASVPLLRSSSAMRSSPAMWRSLCPCIAAAAAVGAHCCAARGTSPRVLEEQRQHRGTCTQRCPGAADASAPWRVPNEHPFALLKLVRLRNVCEGVGTSGARLQLLLFYFKCGPKAEPGEPCARGGASEG
jgi:hypothetical protein